MHAKAQKLYEVLSKVPADKHSETLGALIAFFGIWGGATSERSERQALESAFRIVTEQIERGNKSK